MLTTPIPHHSAHNRHPRISPVVPQEHLTSASPERRSLTAAYWLSGALALAALLASVVGVFSPSVFRDPAMTAGNARGTSLVILAIAIPALLASMVLAARGSLRAQIVWLGALGYLAYNGVIFAFDTAFNDLFLVYVAMLALAVWSLVALLTRVDALRIWSSFRAGVSTRLIAAYLLVVVVLFALTWLGQIVPALVTHSAPSVLRGTTMLTSPVHVLDLGFSLPVSALGAVWLWQRKPWGCVLAGLMLVTLTIESASIAVDQWFGSLSDPRASAAMAPVFAVFTLIGLAPTVMLLMHLRSDSHASAGEGV
jgi:hypothetical protein